MRNDKERLIDIVESIDRIQRYSKRGRNSVEGNELVQTWIVHHIEILGEAARGVSEDFRKRHPEVPWREMVSMRNVLAHEYVGFDIERVWATVERDLPPLRRQIERIIAELGDPTQG